MTTKSAIQHTPGPWLVRVERAAMETSSARYFVDAGKWVLAETKALPPRLTEEAEANARLIAAAPDLLEAAKHAVMEWRLHGQLTDSCRVLEAAIRKAVGE